MSQEKYIGVVRIVQVSATKYGIERLERSTVTSGYLWWRRVDTSHHWKPWGFVFDPKKYAGWISRIGPIYGDMVRRYFDSVATAEDYLEEARKPYPIVVKDPA
jgi:hypothetical protein